jgi:flagellar hook-length control protein FliK
MDDDTSASTAVRAAPPAIASAPAADDTPAPPTEGDESKPVTKATITPPAPSPAPITIAQPAPAASPTVAARPTAPSATPAAPQTLSGLDDLADQNASRVLTALRTLRTSGADSSISVNLEPAHLGSVRLEMTTRNGEVSVRITADGHSAADTLTTAAPALRRELEADGIRLADLHVGVGTGQTDSTDGRSANQQSNDRGTDLPGSDRAPSTGTSRSTNHTPLSTPHRPDPGAGLAVDL